MTIENSQNKNINTDSSLKEALSFMIANGVSNMNDVPGINSNETQNNENSKEDFSTETASSCKQPGEMTEDIMGSILGENSENIENQGSDKINELVSSNEINSDIIKSLYQFINESCEQYKQITNNLIHFD